VTLFTTVATLLEHEASTVCSVCQHRHVHRVAELGGGSGCRCCPKCWRLRTQSLEARFADLFPDLVARCPVRRGKRIVTKPIFEEALARMRAESERLEEELRAQGIDIPAEEP